MTSRRSSLPSTRWPTVVAGSRAGRAERDARREGGAERADGGDGESGPGELVHVGVRRTGWRPPVPAGCHDEAMPHSRELDIVLFGATGFTGGADRRRTSPTTAPTASAGAGRPQPGQARAGARPAGRDDAGAGGPRADRRRLRRPGRPGRPGGPHPGRDLDRRAVRRPRRGRSSAPAPTPAPTTATSPARASSSTGCTSPTTQTAVACGARLVHGCGFDSIPHDLGAMFTVEHLPADVPIDLRGVVRAGGLPSGGTFETALTGMSRVRHIREAAQARKRVEPRPGGPLVARRGRQAAPRRGPRLLAAAAADHGPGDRGPQRRGPAVVRAEVPLLPLRRHQDAAVRRRRRRRHGRRSAWPPRSSRPRPADEVVPGRRRARPRARASVRGSPSTSSARRGGETVHTRVSGGDPGYTETAMMLAESGLCLAFDDNPRRGRAGDHRPGDGRATCWPGCRPAA